jgi:hypothetical protein
MAKSDIDPELLKQAAELNIEVTDEATAEAVQQAIDEVLAEDAGNGGNPLDHDGDGKAGGAKTNDPPSERDVLKARATELGITFPANVKTEKLKELIAAAENPTPASTAKTYPYRVNRDFWTENKKDPDSPIRTRKGTIVEMTADDAQDGLESGAISRVKD